MTRISEEELERLRKITATHTGGIEMRQRTALAMMDELRERRAADLTAEDVVVVREIRDYLDGRDDPSGYLGQFGRRAFAVLDRLLAQGEKP